jgi:membrane associated rhomboid family serine protease
LDEHPAAQREPAINAPWPAVVLMAALLGAYALQRLLGPEATIEAYGFAPRDLSDGRWVTLITSLFLHGGWLHLGMNAVWALALAPPVSRLFGSRPSGAVALWLLFLISGVIGDLGFAAVQWDRSDLVLVGASGGVAGLMGAASRLLGRRHSLASLRDPSVVSMGASWIGINLLLAALGGTPLLDGAVIGWEAHIAGYAAGLLLVGPMARVSARADDVLGRSSAQR